MLINSVALLQEYRRRGKCLPAFNIYNLETIKAALNAAKATASPIILAFGESYLPHADFAVIAALVRQLTENHPYSVVLHLDHCKSIAHITEAIDCGFTSVMYDGSQLPIEENILYTREAVSYAHSRNVSVEGELGGMNNEDGSGESGTICFTDPWQSQHYVEQTGIDSLAVSVGNAHGIYKGKPQLQWDLIEQIYSRVGIPLVLHGCSGIPKSDIALAAQKAVAKINVNTELAMGAAARVAAELAAGQARYECLTAAAQDEMTKTMTGFLL